MKFPKGTRVQKNKEFMKIYTIWKSMMYRCYNENYSSYNNYGARGVHVSDSWKDKEVFFDTIDQVEGFDLQLILSGDLQLDKDIKVKGNKLYSLETCMFVSPSENSGNKRNNRECVAVSPDLVKYTFKNRAKFAREYDLSSRHIWHVLSGSTKTHKGWRFYYKDDFKEEYIHTLATRILYGVSPKGKVFKFSNIKSFANEHQLSAPNISMVLSGKQNNHKQWLFYEQKDFKTEYAKPYIKRSFKGISPNDAEFVFNNMTKFAKDNGLSQSRISNSIKTGDIYLGWKFKELTSK